MSLGIFTCCLSRAYTAMEKSNNARLYAVHVQPQAKPCIMASTQACDLFNCQTINVIKVDVFLTNENIIK